MEAKTSVSTIIPLALKVLKEDEGY